jgi:hypothetical protein
MAKKKAFALRLDADLLDAIEKWAADEFRSANGQIEWIIHQALLKEGRLKKNREATEPESQASELKTDLETET